MNESLSYFLPVEANSTDLSAWADILPNPYRVLRANCFADVFVIDSTGAVHMLEVSGGSVTRIAASEEEFWRRCVDDKEGWLVRPLVERCRAAGMHLGPGRCYAFTTMPFLGGEYTLDNIWVCSWGEWFGVTGSVYSQTKHLPDGSTVSIDIVD